MKRTVLVILFSSLMGFGLAFVWFASVGGAKAQSIEQRPLLGVMEATGAQAATPVTTTVTYQGQLRSDNNWVNGSCTMIFRLYDHPTASTNQIGNAVTASVPVVNGRFTAELNFGSGAFNGAGRWLDIRVNCGDGVVTLTPRQPLTAAPYALYALSSGALDGFPVASEVPSSSQILQWNGSAWAPGDAWLTGGNGGTSAGSHFLGTTDNQDLVLKTNNAEALRIDTTQNLGIGNNHYFGYRPDNTFSYNTKTMGHYALGWFSDPWNGFGSTAWLSGYAGLKIFTDGALALSLDQDGNLNLTSGSLTVDNKVVLNNNMLQLRGASDANHGMRYNAAVDGPEFRGFSGFIWSTGSAGATERMRLTASGRLGIGTDNPKDGLDVRNGNIQVTDSDGKTRVRLDKTYATNGNGRFWLYNANDKAYFYAGNNGTESTIPLVGILTTDGTTPVAGMYLDNNDKGVVYGDVKSFRVPNPNQPGTDIVYASLEGPEAAAYIRGTAHLVNGRATITFPDHFKAVATLPGMTVQLTPNSADSLGLAVVSKSLDGVEVRELMQGTGSYDFDYLVTAVRQGYENYEVIRSTNETRIADPLAKP